MASKVVDWLQIVGNLGLIAGLVLVAVQIKQNTDITRAQVTADAWTAELNLALAMMGEEPQLAFTNSVYRPDSLSEEDAVVLDRYYHFILTQIGRYRSMEDYNLASNTDNLIRAVTFDLRSPFGARWWETAKRHGYYANSRDRIDRVLGESNVPNASRKFFDELRGTRLPE